MVFFLSLIRNGQVSFPDCNIFEVCKSECLCSGRTKASKTAACTMPASGQSFQVVPLLNTHFQSCKMRSQQGLCLASFTNADDNFAFPNSVFSPAVHAVLTWTSYKGGQFVTMLDSLCQWSFTP